MRIVYLRFCFLVMFLVALCAGLDLRGQLLVSKNIGATTPLAWGDYDKMGIEISCSTTERHCESSRTIWRVPQLRSSMRE